MTKNNQDLPKFTIRQLMEAGVHFGHKTMRRNTKMSKYIYGVRNGLSIINLETTAKLLHEALRVCREIAKNNGRILFVSTKKQAFEVVASSAKKCGQYYVNDRWLGGMLTNWKTVSQSIKTLKKIEDQLNGDEIGLNKKEKLVLERKRQKLEKCLGGIKEMGGFPDLVFVIDTNRESLAIAEAKNLGIPIMAILDTNSNPNGITHPIPGNDDSAKAIKLYCHLISDAIISGIKENMVMSGIDVKLLEEDFSAGKFLLNNKNNDKKSASQKFAVKKDLNSKEESRPKKIDNKTEKSENSEEITTQAVRPEEKKTPAKTSPKKISAKYVPAKDSGKTHKNKEK